ncbi:hypothetical protein Klosneuvirus_4_105 [Klosneuvirus KNV1]|uniref:Uncharacterized protein n=1 Tax=Klosneuvirus KNV1 TaxID=1977640 RepID=A0A1V0SKN6_9VIRU|nr:hypothetical protein Klosneuvirus_4_105 [Klosneuvirus KNV1]
MEKLPIELIQYINEKLDYINQLNFKAISQGFYASIMIQQLPYLLTMYKFHQSDDSNYTFYTIFPMNCFRLDEFYIINQQYLEDKHLWDYDVYVLNSNKYIQKPHDISDFDEFEYWISYNADIKDYNSCDEDYGLEYRKSTINIKVNDNRDGIYVDYKPFNMKEFVLKCIGIANERIM